MLLFRPTSLSSSPVFVVVVVVVVLFFLSMNECISVAFSFFMCVSNFLFFSSLMPYPLISFFLLSTKNKTITEFEFVNLISYFLFCENEFDLIICFSFFFFSFFPPRVSATITNSPVFDCCYAD